MIGHVLHHLTSITPAIVYGNEQQTICQEIKDKERENLRERDIRWVLREFCREWDMTRTKRET